MSIAEATIKAIDTTIHTNAGLIHHCIDLSYVHGEVLDAAGLPEVMYEPHLRPNGTQCGYMPFDTPDGKAWYCTKCGASGVIEPPGPIRE